MKYPLETIALFGSYARNDATDGSDVDILVELNGKMGFSFFDMAEEIEKELGVKTDVITKPSLREKFFDLIRKDLIYV